MIDRLIKSIIVLLVAIDQLLQILISIPRYILQGGFELNPDETISSVVGKNAIAGKRWALICEYIIDRFFMIFTGEIGHCRKHIEHDES